MRTLFVRPHGNLAGLDGLRAIAVLLVLVYHCGLWSGALLLVPPGPMLKLLNGCRMGVDVFFVLSGFLIGRILLQDLVHDGRLHWAGFFVRRSFRIVPAYWLVLAGLMLLSAGGIGGAWFFLFGTSDPSVLRRLAWENFAYLNNYLQPSDGVTVMSWSWSLCVEEHFYLLLPLLLWLIFRVAPRKRLPLLVACSFVPVALRAFEYSADPMLAPADGPYFRSHDRFDQLLVGVVVAYLEVVHPGLIGRAAKRLSRVVWPAGLALVALAWDRGGFLERGSFPVVWQYTAMGIGVALLMVNVLHLPNAVTRFLSGAGWYPIARVSYGMYLVHPFVIFSLHPLPVSAGEPAGFLLLGACVFAASWALAAAMFIVVERPMLEAGTALARRIDERATAGRGDAPGRRVPPD